MPNIDWDSVQESAGGSYKNFYADGDYTAKCDSVEIKEVGQNGSVIMKFHFEEGKDGQYPTADHWLSFKNDNWRIWHNKCLMVALGATEDAAKKAVEMAEGKDGKESVMKGYEAVYKKLLAKKPEVKIEVYTDDRGYARAEFKDRNVAMPHDSGNASKGDNPTDLPLTDDISEEEIPF